MTATAKPVKAIRIDPYNRQVVAIELATKLEESEYLPEATTVELQYDAIRAAVFHHRADRPGYVEHISLGFADRERKVTVHGWLDEEGLLMDWDKQRFLRLAAYPSPLAGNLILTAEDHYGNAIDWPNALSLAHVWGMVTWVDAENVEVPAPTISSADEHMQPIPGTATDLRTGAPVPPGDDPKWTYHDQPAKGE